MARRFWEEKDNHLHKACLPTFYNNFEVTSVAFMRLPEVRKWHSRVSEEEVRRFDASILCYTCGGIFWCSYTSLVAAVRGVPEKVG